jgi:hypothetical protein
MAVDLAETDNDFELKKDTEERNLHRMAKVHDILEISQGSQNLHTTQNKSRMQNNQMAAAGYISDTEQII